MREVCNALTYIVISVTYFIFYFFLIITTLLLFFNAQNANTYFHQTKMYIHVHVFYEKPHSLITYIFIIQGSR